MKIQILFIASLVRFAATKKQSFKKRSSFHSKKISDDDDDFSDYGDEMEEYSWDEEYEEMSDDYDDECYSESDRESGMSINKRVTSKLGSMRDTIPDAGQHLKSATMSRLEMAASRVRLYAREVRGAHSSEFEGAMIKATRPDDSPAKEKHVSRLVDTVQVFPTASGPSSADYYFIMLHKLWSRMVESDWRSKSKALYIFHRMAVVLDPQLHLEFVTRYERMASMTHKPSKTRYYQMSVLTVKSRTRTADSIFIRHYALYVVKRFVEFSGRFEQLQVTSCGASRSGSTQGLPHSQSLIRLLGSARDVIELALVSLDAVRNHGRHRETAHVVPVQCASLIIEDCFIAKRHRDALWEIYADKLRSLMIYQKKLVDEDNRQLDGEEVKATLALCEWTRDAIPRVGRTVTGVSKMIESSGIRTPTGLGPIDKDLAEHEEWLKGQQE